MAQLNDLLILGKSVLIGDLKVNSKIIQGSPSTDSTILNMNRLQSDLYVAGDGSAPNSPKVPGFYLGKSSSDENRHMDIVSGADYSYIDFNKASTVEDFKVRLIANVTTGLTELQWGSATNPKFLINGITCSTVGFHVQRTLGDGYGLGLYGSTPHNEYGIHMSYTATYGQHGPVAGDWATYFCFDGANNRGWIFKHAGTNVASIGGTGKARFDDTVFGYAYSKSNNKAAFMWDKPSSNYTGVGANGTADTIYFGACSGDGSWITDYKQKWIFNGSVTADSFIGNASSASKLNILRSVSGNSHALALQNEFNANKASIPRNCISTYYSTAYGNGSLYMGYFLSGYDTNPYGGFFVAHYGTPYYVGISNGSYTQSQLWKAGDAVTGAVWNDYAEYRESDCEDFGYVLCEKGDDTLTKTTERLSHFAGVSSDTWGFSQGKTEQATTPIAVAGRVLVYPYQNKMNYKPGDCVCAAPGGTVDIMTREEVIQYPDRMVGTVSCVPDYEEWGGGEGADRDPVKVNGRIWIKVK